MFLPPVNRRLLGLERLPQDALGLQALRHRQPVDGHYIADLQLCCSCSASTRWSAA
ncbi:MAG: hypothetical protein WDO13_19855 [Verrucomicrobiota bacterium]